MELINHGVIEALPKSTDWIAGATSEILYEVRNPSGNWSSWLVLKERQKFGLLETMACVSFAANTLCEIQIKHQTGTERNFSDRYLAKTSGTTSAGNYIFVVADTLRKYGVVNEEEWPTPPNPTWNTYYSEIPQFIKDRAKDQFLDKYTIQTEWIEVSEGEINKHLKHAPLMILIPGHAVAGIALSVSGGIVTYLDTYGEPFIKTTRIGNIKNVFKILLTVKNMNQTKIVLGKDGQTVYKAVPIATDFENFKKQASVEGIEVPNPIPPSSSL